MTVRAGLLAPAAAILFAAGGMPVPPAQAQMQAAPTPVQAVPVQARDSVIDVLTNDPRFATTIKMIYVGGAASRLSTARDLTVFAATDDGWDRGSYGGMLSSMTSTGAASEFPDSTDIIAVLRGFFVRGEPPAPTGREVKFESVAGRPIDFDGRTMTVKWVAPDGATRSARVDGAPILATNGVIYPVDAVVGQ